MAKILVVGDAGSPLIRARGLIERAAGHEISFVSPRDASVPGARVFALPQRIARTRVVRPLGMSFLVDHVIRRVRPDVIHVHYAYQAFATVPLIRFHPLIVSVMGGDVLADQGFRGHRPRLVKLLLDHADAITSKSAFLDAALADIGNYGRKLHRVTWGIDLDHFNPSRDTAALRRRLRIDATDLVFFDPRLAEPLYNKHVILHAFARYLEIGPPAVLVVSELGGSTEYLAALRRTAAELGIAQRVRFVGVIDHAEMADFYALAAVTISIPSSDGFPQTMYEAAASGSFLIVGDLPQYGEALRDGLMALSVRVAEADDLAKALLWVVQHPDARTEAVKAGRDFVARAADKTAEERAVLRIYDDLLAAAACQATSRRGMELLH